MSSRSYPDRPFLAVSAAIIKDGRVLIVRRATSPMLGLYTLPGGVVEAGETLEQALVREITEETSLTIAPVGLAGYRDAIFHDKDKRVERHFVIMAFAAKWVAGEPKLNEELHDYHWLTPKELSTLKTTEGLYEIVEAAFERYAAAG